MSLRTIITPTKVSVFEPSGADGNDPFRNPTSYVRNILFDGRFGYYQEAASVDILVSHAAVAADAGREWSGRSTIVVTYTGRVAASHVLLSHTLGIVPRFKVADGNDALISPARPIQKVTSSGFTAYRTARFRATTTQIIMDEIAIPGTLGLPAFNATYHVRVFSPIGPVSGKKGFLATASAVEMAQGAVDSALRSLRVAKSGETHMIKPLGRASDCKRGQFRFVTADGTIYDTDSALFLNSAPYNGSFAGPAVLDVVL